MDERIRRLERSGDPEDLIRAGQLRCKVEGCLKHEIETVSVYEDYERLCTVLHLGLAGDEQMKILFNMRRLNYDYEILARIKAKVAMHLAKCPRCGVKNDIDYTTAIINELRRQQDGRANDERQRYARGARQPLLRRVQGYSSDWL